jgi:sarcosine oxidase
MNDAYDAIIIGLGAMGSAAAYHLAKSGRRVLGLDRFHPPHELGSSHGLTRIIREAYFEHPLYVPLVQRAYELWAELEKRSGRRLLTPTGGLMIGPPDGALVKGALRSAREHRLEHELLGPAELRRRFPAFKPAPDAVAVWEPRAGVLIPELAMRTHLELAAELGATLRFDEPAVSWSATVGGVRVSTAKGSCQAERLLLSAGAWMSELLPDWQLPLKVERQVLCWFEPLGNREPLSRIPIYICEYAPARFFYGFPDSPDGMKAALHHQGESTEPGNVCRQVATREIEAVRVLLAGLLPDGAGALRSATVCLYTNTPDEHFVLGLHPKHPQVVLASPCSGHGFKFSPAIGELAACLLLGKEPAFDLSLFRPERFMPREGTVSAL